MGRRPLAVAILLLVAMALYVATHFRIRTDILAFMPSGADAAIGSLSRQLSDSELSRTVVLTVGAKHDAAALAGATRIATALRASPQVAWVRDGIGGDRPEAFYDLYFPRRYGFLSDDPDREIPRMLESNALAERARQLRRALSGPRSPLVARTAAADPLLAFPAQLERMRRDAAGLTLRDGHFVTDEEPRYAVIFFGTRASAFDAARQRAMEAELAAIVDRASRDVGEPLRVEQSGAGHFAAEIQGSMLRDVRRIVVASALGMVLLFVGLFGSLRALAIVMVPALVGMLVAATAGLLVYGSLNGLSVAFGLALSGVSVDYAIHLLTHLTSEPASEASGVARRIRPSLLLGGATTVASLGGVAFSSFPGFHQMGLLAAVGVGAALCVALAWIPAVSGSVPRRSTAPGRERVVGALVASLRRHRRILLLPILASLVAGVACVPRLHWVDDLRQLTVLDPALLAEEGRVRARVARFDANRFAIVLADDLETALVANDALYRELERQVARGTLDAFRSLHAFLWSGALQRENERMLRSDPSLPERLDAVYAREGFRPGAFAAFGQALRKAPPAPLTLAELRASPLADAVRPFVADIPGHSALLTYLRGVHDEDALREVVESVPHARLFDQRRFVRQVYAQYRERTLIVVVSGCFAVFALLWLRYRRLRESAAALLPSLAVALLLVVLAAALGVKTHLLHLVGLVLVMGMGVDYGIFVVDSGGESRELGVTLRSLLLSWLTTIVPFGALALSEQPVLNSLGATVAIGVTLAFLLAPLALLLVRDADAEG